MSSGQGIKVLWTYARYVGAFLLALILGPLRALANWIRGHTHD